MKKRLIFLIVFAFLGVSTFAQVSITSTGSYSQDFNTLPYTGTITAWVNNFTLLNWFANRSATPPLDSIRIGHGSTTKVGLFSFGAVGSTERALGSLASGTTGTIAYGVLLQNNSGVAINDIRISYYGEQWRNAGKTSKDTLKFYYRISATAIYDPQAGKDSLWTPVSALHFISPIDTLPSSALNGNLAANRTIFNNISIPSIYIPAGSYVMFKWEDVNDPLADHALAVDSLNIAWTIPPLTTGTISGSPFCVTNTSGTAVTVPYNITGTYNAGNFFYAYLSDSMGSFLAETQIGSVVSQTAGTFNCTIPAGTYTGTHYRIRVKATNPATIGTDNGVYLTIINGIPTVNSVIATALDGKVKLSWNNPTACYNELMIVTKPSTSVTAIANGNGSAYTANSPFFTDPLNTDFDGTGRVVYKSASPGNTVTISGLTDGTQYYFRFFIRKDTIWNNAVEVNATPTKVPKIEFSEIMYNDPSSGTLGDSLEFIEFYNNDIASANMGHWKMSAGVSYTFPSGTILNPNHYLVLAKKATAVNNFFSLTGTLQWTGGALSNNGEHLELQDSLNNVVDSLTYSSNAPWPTAANGHGPSIRFCDYNHDNSLPSEWSASTEFVDSLNHVAVYATPGSGCVITPDVIPPVAVGAYATSLNTVVVLLNEAVGLTSAQTASNYTWHGTTTSTATLKPFALDTVVLTLTPPLTLGIPDTLSVTGIHDTAGNIMTQIYTFPIKYGTIFSTLDTIVYWNFPYNPDDLMADGGIPANLNQTINREPTFIYSYSFLAGSPTYALKTSYWQSGAGSKYWKVQFTTLQYDSVRLCSKQYSSTNGPRDFGIEYSINGTSWTPVPGATVLCSDDYVSGVISDLLLPHACYYQPVVFLRWIMKSDTAATGIDSVVSAGSSRIDEIYVGGRYDPFVGINREQQDQLMTFKVYPNPSNGQIFLQLSRKTSVEINIFDLTGKQVYTKDFEGIKNPLNLSALQNGIYFISLTDESTGYRSYQKLIIH